MTDISPKEILSRFMTGVAEQQSATNQLLNELFELQRGQQDALEEQSRSIHDFHATFKDLIARVTTLEDRGRKPKGFEP